MSAGSSRIRTAVARSAAALAGSWVGSRFAAARAASRAVAGMRELAAELTAGLERRVDGPVGVRELCGALCEAMGERRGGRRVALRFERFPDEMEATGLWLEFQDFDLVVVEERAEAVQQLVILGHELWHMHAGHCHHHMAGTGTAVRTPAGEPGRPAGTLPPTLSAALTRGGTPIAARKGAHEDDEREADHFGHRLAAGLRTWLTHSRAAEKWPSDQVAAVQASLGYRRPQSGPRR